MKTRNRIQLFLSAIFAASLLLSCNSQVVTTYGSDGSQTSQKVKFKSKDKQEIIPKRSSPRVSQNSPYDSWKVTLDTTISISDTKKERIVHYLSPTAKPKIEAVKLVEEYTLSNSEFVLSKRTYSVLNELILKMNVEMDNSISSLQNMLDGQIQGLTIKSLDKIPNTRIVLMEYSIDENLIKFNKTQLESEIIISLEKLDEIQTAEPNYINFPHVVSNDPSIGYCWRLNNTGQFGGIVGADIKAFNAWDIQTGNSDVLVGIIDTGVDDQHEDLRNNMWINPGEDGTDSNGNSKRDNGIDDDNNGYVDDYRGWDFYEDDNDPSDSKTHGTHVAGIVGAEGNNQIGISGVCWKVGLVSIKFLGPNGGTTFDAISAVEYATNIGVDFTNNSWGGGGYSSTLEGAIERAGENDILFIASAGNDSKDNDAIPKYPSSYPSDNIISVLSTDDKDQLSWFSNYGKASVDVGAPGSFIYSTLPNNSYGYNSGTSMAAPMVSGICALIKSQLPNLTAAQIKARVLQMADKISSLSGKCVTGARVNAYESLQSFSSVNVPTGSIVPFYGDKALIPDNWVICDGSIIQDPLSPYHNTASPDLRGRFIMGENKEYPARTLGGINEVNPHSHFFSDSDNRVWFPRLSGNGYINAYNPATRASAFDRNLRNLSAPNNARNPYNTHGHLNGISNISGNTNSGGAHDNKPLFYSTIYILKIK